ncbi:MAG TPA: ATP-binding protein, partial [Dissulfurispiraceae bacterium]|nr:ATP-binding protein [Dissulfurispiraceae bacterium]
EAVIVQNGTVLFASAPDVASLAGAGNAIPAGNITSISLRDRKYYAYRTHLAAQNWDVTVIRNAGEFLSLYDSVKESYLITVAIFFINLVLVYYFVRNTINQPIENIVEALRNNHKPNYRGIQEYEQLSMSLEQLIDERERFVEKLLQDQVMENLRATTRGVAHNFNNILVSALGYASLGRMKIENALQQKTNDREKTLKDVMKYLESIEQAAERASALAQQLSSIAQARGAGHGHFAAIDMRSFLMDLQPIIRSLFSQDTMVSFDLDEALPPVYGDAGQLQQVLLNLCINSRDAMPKGGRLAVKASVAPETAAEAESSPGRTGTYVRISVQDSGEGMDEVTLANIFQPFFTTKSMDQGTGLGLTMVDMIMKAHNGFVTVASAPGSGTTFSLSLPAGDSAA